MCLTFQPTRCRIMASGGHNVSCSLYSGMLQLETTIISAMSPKSSKALLNKTQETSNTLGLLSPPKCHTCTTPHSRTPLQMQPDNLQLQSHQISMPRATPLTNHEDPPSQFDPSQVSAAPQQTLQMPLVNEKHNHSWGDIHAIKCTNTKVFRIVSKNTGTLNPYSLDPLAITQELSTMDVHVFAAQETNVHWDMATKYQLYQQ